MTTNFKIQTTSSKSATVDPIGAQHPSLTQIQKNSFPIIKFSE